MSSYDKLQTIRHFRTVTKAMLFLGYAPESLKERIDKIAEEKE